MIQCATAHARSNSSKMSRNAPVTQTRSCCEHSPPLTPKSAASTTQSRRLKTQYKSQKQPPTKALLSILKETSPLTARTNRFGADHDLSDPDCFRVHEFADAG